MRVPQFNRSKRNRTAELDSVSKMRLAKAELDATARDFKVLVADDSPIYRKLVEHTLSEKQYTVLFAKSGREAIDLFSEHQPSLVIRDWMMPDLSGIEAANPFTSLFFSVGVGHRIVELHRQLEAKNRLRLSLDV